MSTLSPNSKFKYCSFDSRFGTNIQYLCLKHERCCPPGCCVTFSVKKIELAIIWIFLFSCAVLFYCISKYCKYRQRRNNSIHLQPMRRTNLHSNSMAARRFQAMTDCSHCNNLDLPPKYIEAIHMPKVIQPISRAQVHEMNKSTHANVNHLNDISLPSYETATNKNTQHNRTT